MSDKFNFTKKALDALPTPASGQRKFYYDTDVRGLALRVMSSGAKYFYMYKWIGGKPQKTKLGPYPDMTIEQARNRAKEENAAVVRGHDPAAERERKRAEWTFEDLFKWYLEAHAKPRKRSWKRDERHYELHLQAPLGALPLSKVSRSSVRELHMAIRKASGPYAANRLLALVSVVFSQAIAHELHPGPNPAAGIECFPEESRDRRLSAAEVPRLIAALETEPNVTLRDFIFILFFTGARRSNVLAMRWDEIDMDERIWRIPMTKNGKPQIVPLEEPELKILERRLSGAEGNPWVFPGRSDNSSGHLTRPEHGWIRILKRAGINGLRLHDLRRSLGSWMVDTGASLPMIGQALHHQSQSTTAVYARMSLAPLRHAKSRALQAILASGKKTPDESIVT